MPENLIPVVILATGAVEYLPAGVPVSAASLAPNGLARWDLSRDDGDMPNPVRLPDGRKARVESYREEALRLRAELNALRPYLASVDRLCDESLSLGGLIAGFQDARDTYLRSIGRGAEVDERKANEEPAILEPMPYTVVRTDVVTAGDWDATIAHDGSVGRIWSNERPAGWAFPTNRWVAYGVDGERIAIGGPEKSHQETRDAVNAALAAYCSAEAIRVHPSGDTAGLKPERGATLASLAEVAAKDANHIGCTCATQLGEMPPIRDVRRKVIECATEGDLKQAAAHALFGLMLEEDQTR